MKLGEVILFVITVALGEVYSVFIQWMNDSPKPKLWRVENKKVQFTLSKTFSASSDTIMVLLCFCCAVLIKLRSTNIV